MSFPQCILIVCGLIVSLAGGCNRNESIRTYTVKHPDETEEQAVTVPSPPDETPAGWVAQPLRSVGVAGMHEIQHYSAGSSAVDVSLTHIAGTFGDMSANINRWRGQVGLPAVTDTSIDRPLEVRDDEGRMYDFTGPAEAGGQRLIVVVFEESDGAYMARMIGPADVVQQQLPTFEQYIDSL